MADLIAWGWKGLGRCLDCRRKAFLGAVSGWMVAGFIAIFGDARQLLAAALLFAAALSLLWLAHRIALAIRRKLPPGPDKDHPAA